jgi:carbonic anhydrase
VGDGILQELLERNARHVASLPADHFDAVQSGQEPAVVSISCSDSRVPQDGMWAVEEAGWLFAPSTIGNQVTDRHRGEPCIDGSVLYPIAETGTDVACVVGHTGCGAIEAALDAVRAGGVDAPPGIAKWIEGLVPIVEAGLNVDHGQDGRLLDRLAEYNVDRQVEALLESESVPSSVDVFGFVYDFQGRYGKERGRVALVNANGLTDERRLRELVPAGFERSVHRLQ